MESVYKLNANELSVDFINSLKKLFQDQEIVVTVRSVQKEKKLTVRYAEKILQSVRNIENGDIKTFTGDEFNELTQKLLKQ
jgi:hypothetical protein